MTTAVVLTGRLTDEGHLELDEPIPLGAGPVRVTLEPVKQAASSSLKWPSDEELRERKKDMDAAIGCLSDEDARQILEAITPRDPDPAGRRARLAALAGSVSDKDTREILEIVETHFEQVDPDEWR
jgi:hypothetical protein